MEKPSIPALKQVLSYISNINLTADQQWTSDIAPYIFPPSILSPQLLLKIITYSIELFRQEPTLLELKPPIFIVGDLHGQFYDFRTLISLSNSTQFVPKSELDLKSSQRGLSDLPNLPFNIDLSPSHSYLFLGDYVDRGSFSCEIIISLLCLKILYPTQIYMIRGNHETRTMTSHKFDNNFNFQTELESKFPDERDIDLYQDFMDVFDCLPLGAIINTLEGRWFCAHGGIGKKLTSLNQLRELDRISEPPLNGTFCDVMWSDPLLEDLLAEINVKTDADYEEFLDLDYLPNVVRGCSSLYGHASILTFLKTNELHGIIRAHQSKDLGYMTHYKDTWYKPYYYPMVITVFSAANYVGTHGNLAAFLHFKSDTSGIDIIQFDAKQTARIYLAPNPKGERFSFPPIQANVPLNEAKKSVNSEVFTDESDLFEFSRLPLRQRISTAPVTTKLKRKSITLLQQGTLGEQGSEKFRLAMSTSIECEKHPGWNSIRRATLAVVKFKTSPNLKKVQKSASLHTSSDNASSTKSSDDDTFSSATSDTIPKVQASGGNAGNEDGSTPPLSRSKSENTPVVFSRVRSSNMAPEDDQQIRILFDTIDKNGDGVITRKEFSNFLYNIEEYNFNHGHELFNQIDINSDGTVDFTEFCSYISTLELLPEESIAASDD